MAYRYVSACCIFLTILLPVSCFRTYTEDDILRLREEVRDMFQHAYEGYLKYAGNYDELRPLSCDGVDTWGSYSLTLIDALDTLAVMGNYSEFRRVVDILTQKTNFDADINVSVFETNIRIVGGLLGAHLMSLRAGVDIEPGWPCNGPLLRLAEDVAKRLLPAFDTKTGMPYGTVNLRHGVPPGETTVTCTAGVGTFIVEFGALSRLTGDPIYEEVALNALYALWKHRSPIGLFGNHIDVQSGRWTAQDAGIGAGVDSYYEYLVKGALMLNRPELLEMFHTGRKAIDKYLKRDDWHVWVSMNKGQVTLPVFQSLEAYWPGVLSLIGDIGPAMKTLHNYHSVWKQYGFLPEFYNIPSAEAGANRENYPLRPELIESVMYLYRATSDPYLLEVGEDMLRSIQYSAKTSCGYATIKNVRDHRKEDRMESFFLAETTKYLYLLFDPDNFLHNDGREGTLRETPNGVCVIHAGGYIFNTEAHPIDPSALRCCHDNSDWLKDYSAEKFLGEELKIKEYKDEMNRCAEDVPNLQNIENLTVEIEASTMDMDLTRQKMVAEVMDVLKALENESSNDMQKEQENKPNASEVLSETSKGNAYGTTLNEAVAVEKAFEKIITTFKPVIKLHEKVIDAESKLTDLLVFFEKIVNDYIMKNNITTADLLNNFDRTLIDKKAKVNQVPLKQWIQNEDRMTFIKFLVDTFKGLHSLQKQHQKTSPENIAKKAKDFLDSLKNGTDESVLKQKFPKIMEIFKNSQTNYEKLGAKKNLILDILTYTSQLQSPPGSEEINMREIASIIEVIKEKRQAFETSYKQTKSNSLNLKLFGELYSMLPRMDELNETEKNTSSTLVDKTHTDSGKSERNDDIILIHQTYKNVTETILDAKVTEQTLEKEQVEKSTQANDIPHEDDYGPDVGKGSVEPVNLNKMSESLIKSENKSPNQPVETKKIIQPSIPPTVQPDIDEIKNNSLLTDFLQTILKSALPAKPKFEPQLLLEKIREIGIYHNQPQHFELLTCRAQPFLQRVSINGEFF